MNRISDQSELQSVLQEVRSRTQDGGPVACLKRRFGHVHYADAASVFTERYYSLLKSLCSAYSNSGFDLVVLDPDPEQYYFKHFQKYPAFHFGASDAPESYFRALHEDPGNSPADAIWSRADILACSPLTDDWFVYSDRGVDLSILATSRALPAGERFQFMSRDDVKVIIAAAKDHSTWKVADLADA